MQTLIGKYCKDVKIFTDNIEEEALSTIYDIANHPVFENTPIRIMPDCLTEDAEILTENGFKKIIDITENDLISNYDPNSKKISFLNPVNIIKRPLRENEKVYRYYNDKIGAFMSMSENHRLALRNNLGEKAINVDKFLTKDYIFSSEELLNSFCNISDNYIRLICWVVGDGSIKITHNKSNNYRIRFGLKKQRKIDRIEYLLDQENLKYHKSVTPKQTEFVINTESSKYLISLVGLNKEYPRILTKMSRKQSEVFFEELIQVDGDYENYLKNLGYRINSKRKSDVDIISEIASINGRLSNIKERFINGGYSKTKMFYITLIKSDKVENKMPNGFSSLEWRREEISYNKNVVCVETNTGFFIAKQNGITFVTGNCHQGKGIVIGFTAPLGEYVNPSFVGCDLGCQMTSLFYEGLVKEEDYPDLEHKVRNAIPTGFEINKKKVFNDKDFFKFMNQQMRIARSQWPEMVESVNVTEKYVTEMLKRIGMDEGVFYKSPGSLGGGERN